jgi:para-nitrobenzyl esterase
VISESGGGDHVARPGSSLAGRLLDVLGTTADGLLTVPAEQIVEAAGTFAGLFENTWIWRPTLDPVVLPRLPVDAVAAGAGAGIGMLIGSNAHEAAAFRLLHPDLVGRAPLVLGRALGESRAQALIADYASRRPAAPAADVYEALMTDERYGIPSTRLADAQSAHAPTYRFYADLPVPGLPPEARGAHGSEVPYVFGLLPAETPLSQAMQRHWASFVRDGAPGADWPRYSPADRATMVFADDAAVVHDPAGADRRAWDGLTWPSGTWLP